MASPVDTSVKHYRSDIFTSLVLNGQAGSLIGLFDACLVTGFGLQTATSLVVADGVATVLFPSSFPATEDMVILVAGATPAGLNGEQRLTGVSSNTVMFATEEADGAATGTITVRIAPAGWEKVYSGTNKAVYKSLDPQAHGGGMYLRVDDTGTTAARVVGYETMSDVDTGTGPFPTSAQMSGGLYWWKSSVANANAAGWAIVADSRFFIGNMRPYDAAGSAQSTGQSYGFGDFLSGRVTGDAFAVLLCASASANVGNSTPHGLDVGAIAGKYVARDYSGLGSSAAVLLHPFVGTVNSSGNDGTLGSYPDPITGRLWFSTRKIHSGITTATAHVRGVVPGVLHIPMLLSGDEFQPFQKIDGSDFLFGKKLLMCPLSGNGMISAANKGFSAIDITGPWR